MRAALSRVLGGDRIKYEQSRSCQPAAPTGCWRRNSYRAARSPTASPVPTFTQRACPCGSRQRPRQRGGVAAAGAHLSAAAQMERFPYPRLSKALASAYSITVVRRPGYKVNLRPLGLHSFDGRPQYSPTSDTDQASSSQGPDQRAAGPFRTDGRRTACARRGTNR